MKYYRSYRVRCNRGGRRVYIVAHGYRDALRLQCRYGGKITGGS